MPRYRLRFGLVDEGCVRRGRPGGPAGVERRRIGYQPPQGRSGSGPATFGKGAAADDVLRWFVVSRDGTGTHGSGFLPSQGTLTAGNVGDGLPSMLVPGTWVSSQFRGSVSRGEGGRRKTGAGDGVRLRPDPAAATVSISLPRVNRWSTQMEWKGVIVCVEPGRLYEASGVPLARCATQGSQALCT